MNRNIKLLQPLVYCFFPLLISLQHCGKEESNPSSPKEPSKYHIGHKVADFTLKNIDGADVFLYDFKGKVIMLNFFASW